MRTVSEVIESRKNEIFSLSISMMVFMVSMMGMRISLMGMRVVLVVGSGALAVSMRIMVALVWHNSMSSMSMVVDRGRDMLVCHRLNILSRVVRDRLGMNHS